MGRNGSREISQLLETLRSQERTDGSRYQRCTLAEKPDQYVHLGYLPVKVRVSPQEVEWKGSRVN